MMRYLRFGWMILMGLLFVAACTFSVDHNQGKYVCTQVSDCPSPLNCVSGRCLPDYCGQDTECPADYRCNFGVCVSRSGEVTPEDGGILPEPVSCQDHAGCGQDQTCRPAETTAQRICVTRCDVVAQKGCPSGELCVLWEGRGYCSPPLGKSKAGLTCKTDVDCEIHLYCRVVKDFSPISRCTVACDQRLSGKDCPDKAQRCLALRPVDYPIGYCEPLRTLVKEGSVCGGDLVCDSGLSCKFDPQQNLSYCRK